MTTTTHTRLPAAIEAAVQRVRLAARDGGRARRRRAGPGGAVGHQHRAARRPAGRAVRAEPQAGGLRRHLQRNPGRTAWCARCSRATANSSRADHLGHADPGRRPRGRDQGAGRPLRARHPATSASGSCANSTPTWARRMHLKARRRRAQPAAPRGHRPRAGPRHRGHHRPARSAQGAVDRDRPLAGRRDAPDLPAIVMGDLRAAGVKPVKMTVRATEGPGSHVRLLRHRLRPQAHGSRLERERRALRARCPGSAPAGSTARRLRAQQPRQRRRRLRGQHPRSQRPGAVAGHRGGAPTAHVRARGHSGAGATLGQVDPELMTPDPAAGLHRRRRTSQAPPPPAAACTARLRTCSRGAGAPGWRPT